MTLPRASHRLDTVALLHLVDERRRYLKLTWRQVAEQTGGYSSSAFSRLWSVNAETMHADILVSLLVWLGRDTMLRDMIVTSDVADRIVPPRLQPRSGCESP